MLRLRNLDEKFILWLRKNTFLLLRLSIGSIYVLFGGLKYFPQFSPAQEIGVNTVMFLSGNIFSETQSIYLLAVFETIIGLGLISNIQIKWVIRIALFHMLCTFTPLLIFPNILFSDTAFGITLIGQYIIKNFVIIFSLLAIYAHSGLALKKVPNERL